MEDQSPETVSRSRKGRRAGRVAGSVTPGQRALSWNSVSRETDDCATFGAVSRVLNRSPWWGATILACVFAAGIPAPFAASANEWDFEAGMVEEVGVAIPFEVDQYLRDVLVSNLEVQSAMDERRMAGHRATAQWGVFEPDFIATVRREAESRENTRQEFLGQQRTFFTRNDALFDAAVESRLPTGTLVRVGSRVNRLKNNLQVEDNEYRTASGITVTQPLLKNSNIAANMAPIRAAEQETHAVYQETRRQILFVVSQAEMTYWTLYEAVGAYILRKESVEVATEILEDNRARQEAGRMTELDVLQAQAALALRQSQLNDARQRLREASASIRGFLSEMVDGSGEWVFPDSRIEIEEDPDYRQSLDLAYQFDPRLQQQQALLEQARQELLFASDRRLPELNLLANYELTGLGEDFSRSRSELRDDDTDSWFVGVELRIPLGGGISERNQLREARTRRGQARKQLQTIEIEIANEVDILVGSVRNRRERVENYRRVVDFNERVLEDELSALDAGRSTSRRVFEAEEDLTEARLTALESLVEYQVARIQLEVARGTYLRDRGLDLEQSEEEFSPRRTGFYDDEGNNRP